MATYTRLAAILLALLSAPARASEPHEATPYSAVATTAMVGDIVRAIAGDRANVTVLIGEGVDPHLFKPTRADAKTMLDADIIFYNGLLLEGKMTDALVRLARRKPVVPVTESIDPSRLLVPPGAEEYYDPHAWMDPSRWADAARLVADELIAFDPVGEEHYRARAASYIEQFESLDAYAERVLATVPETKRVLVTAHDAFRYFADRYGFEVEGIQGVSTESEAGVRDIERIVALLVEREISAVFVETTIADRNVRALADGARAQGHTVEIGGSLYSDAMGEPGTYEGTYLGMIDHNVTTIARALGGEAPERGWQGKLSR